MQPTLATPRFPLEMLDDIGDVRVAGVDLRILHRSLQHAPRGPYEWFTRQVLVVARLLSNQHQARRRRPRTEDRLGPGPPERARPAIGGGLAQARERRPLRNQLLCARHNASLPASADR